MSHVRVKTTFKQQSDEFGSSEEITIYCDHNLSTDCTSFHYEDGSLVEMFFQDWKSGKDKWDSVERLNFPFKEIWGKELKEGVEYTKFPWESKPILQKVKSNDYLDAIKQSEFHLGEIIHSQKPLSYDAEKIDLKYDDEWREWKTQIKAPEDLSKAITKDTIKKLGI